MSPQPLAIPLRDGSGAADGIHDVPEPMRSIDTPSGSAINGICIPGIDIESGDAVAWAAARVGTAANVHIVSAAHPSTRARHDDMGKQKYDWLCRMISEYPKQEAWTAAFAGTSPGSRASASPNAHGAHERLTNARL